MKFLHISDLHIGKRVNEFSMIEDQKYILNQILRIELSGSLFSSSSCLPSSACRRVAGFRKGSRWTLISPYSSRSSTSRAEDDDEWERLG